MDIREDSKFIDTLVNDLTHKRWYAGRNARVVVWSVFVILYVAFAATVFPGPPIRFLLGVMFVVETAGIVFLAILCGVAAILLSVPGENLSKNLKASLGVLVSVILGIIISIDPQSNLGLAGLLDHMADASVCSMGTVKWAVVPAVVGGWLLSNGAALTVGPPAFLMFSAAGFVGTAVLQFSCTNHQPLHVLLGHMIPAVAIGAGGLWVTNRLFTWSRRLSRKRQDLLKR